MSALSAEQPENQLRVPTLARSRAGVTIGAHSVTDFFSFMAVSLIPLLTARLDLTTGQVALLLGLGSITSGVIQPIVAWASDKLDTRMLGTLGLVVAVVCVSMIGRARSFEMLLLLHGTGAAGIGAFHPPSAAAVGQLSGARRSLGVAVFFLAGMLGGVAGNIFTPRIVDAFAGGDSAAAIDHGFASLTWLIIPGLIAAIGLAWAIHSVPHRHHDAHEHHGRLTKPERRARWGAVWVLYVASVLRFSVNMALVYLFAQWAEAHVLGREGLGELTKAAGLQASALNGPLQGMMQVGMGAGGITLGFVLAARFEKAAFVLFPVLGAAAIALIPAAGRLGDSLVIPSVFALGVVSGVGFGSVIPVSMSLAQRLLPHRTSLASGLMLGGAWSLAFVGPLVAKVVHAGMDDLVLTRRVLEKLGVAVHDLPTFAGGSVAAGWGLDAGFYVAAAVLLVAGLISLRLPHRLIVDSAA